jgi:hypothetical protein
MFCKHYTVYLYVLQSTRGNSYAISSYTLGNSYESYWIHPNTLTLVHHI